MSKYVLRMPPGIGQAETDAMLALATWQGLELRYAGPDDIWVLGKTRGIPAPVVLDGEGKDARTLAIGFFGFVDYLKQEGLVRC